MNNQNMGQENTPAGTAPVGAGITTGIKNTFDNIKTPVFWVAVGFVICKVLDRKKIFKV